MIALLRPRTLRAVATWPVFSFTSHALVRQVERLGCNPRLVIDVGANVGQFAVASINTFPLSGLYAFEPNPAAFSRLQKTMSRYGIATLKNCALGQAVGSRALFLNKHSQSTSLLELDSAHLQAFPEAKTVGEIEVRVSTLDLELEGVALPRPSLLKLDVQGSEAAVLRGGRRTLEQVDYVLCEASFRQLYKGETLFMDLVRMLEDLGFRFVRPIGHLDDPRTGELLQIDALFERKDRVSQAAK